VIKESHEGLYRKISHYDKKKQHSDVLNILEIFWLMFFAKKNKIM